ncbi:MAG TPA: PH domain-containing protein [Patescibacteria group bacterium]|nr:PH domain-containing protein [Patescibacteria group bacterium]
MDPQNQNNPQTNPVPTPYEPPTTVPQEAQQQTPAPLYTPPQQEQEPAPMQYERPKEKGMHPMVVLQPGERIVAVVKRHPFGIISLYVSATIGIGIAAALVFIFLPDFLSQYNADNTNALYVGFALIVTLLVLILGIATSIYWQNQWIITTDSITQIVQNSLFNRQVSQLSMDNLEDVTVNQDGIIPHLFGYGVLKVETAGERSKFSFSYCPDPNNYARQILEIHEQFLEERRNIQNRASGPARPTTTYSGTSQLQ